MGGSKTTVQAAPTTPAPSASESAKDLYEARLEYDPKTAAQEYQLAQQYSPLYASLYKSTIAEQFPGLNQLQETGVQGAIDQLMSAYGQAPESPYAQAQRQALQKQYRDRSNLSGNLYGGRSMAAEDAGVAQLQQAFRTEAQQAAIPYLQILYPQISQTPAVSRGVTPGADTLYNAMYGASQPQYFATPGSPSPAWGLAGSLLGGAGAAGGMTKLFS